MAINCRIATTPDDLMKAFAIRQLVFVEEQGLFSDTDHDKEDDIAIHIVAESAGELIGTVRVYPDEDNVWIGGRLAVRPDRRGTAGSKLIRAAVSEVKKQGASRFIAYIQIQNVSLFERLGWRVVSKEHQLHGRLHYLMEADLD